MPAAPTDVPAPSPGIFSSFSFSNNLVEVSALTALIGSSVAEALVLGNRGSAGVAWAATSSFGTISVVKACFCAASSGWLRETLGIRTAASDLAVGMHLPHSSARAGRVRRNIGEPIAIFCYQQLDAPPNRDKIPRNVQVDWSDVYALDHSTSMMLQGIPDTHVGSPLQVYTYANYTFFRSRDSVFHSSAIFLSTAKLAEVYVLWSHGAALLSVTSATPWLFSFIAAILMEIREVVLGKKPEPEMGNVDIVAGQLPMISRQGGIRKVVLGVAENPRIYPVWRLFWGMGAVVSAASLVFSYIILGQQDRSITLIWAAFQLLWLGVRILVYHVADPADPMALRMPVLRSWDGLPSELKDRVIDLTSALAQCQAFVHPRGRDNYAEDSFTARELVSIFHGTTIETFYPLPAIHLPQIPLHIHAVFGDTLLSSAMWITGSNATTMDLYDSCILVFSFPESGAAETSLTRKVVVPAVRVLSAKSVAPKDSEYALGPSFPPKGVPHPGNGLTWYYWVPCAAGTWLQIQRPAENRILGACTGEVRTEGQLSTFLKLGTLNIGFMGVDDVKTALELARKGADCLVELFG